MSSKAPDSSFSIRKCQDRYVEFPLSPSPVFQKIVTTSSFITRLAIFNLIEPHHLSGIRDSEPNITRLVFLIGGEDRTVAGFHSPFRHTSIKGTGVAMITIHTNKGIAFGIIGCLANHPCRKHRQSHVRQQSPNSNLLHIAFI